MRAAKSLCHPGVCTCSYTNNECCGNKLILVIQYWLILDPIYDSNKLCGSVIYKKYQSFLAGY